jgi:P-type Ca2+ transporter type 2C
MTTEKPPFHTLSPEQVREMLGTGPEGLSASQVQERLERWGYNELAPAKMISPWRILLRQFENLLIIILMVASAISFFLGESLDAWVILAILAACAVLGFIQEYKAEKAAAALQKMAAPAATVIREGKEQVVPAREVVPGDLLLLHTGDRVAADGRVLDQVNLMADESVLTGESTSVAKDAASLPTADLAVADRRCLVFGGTVITYGRGRAYVSATGMDSEFGSIARLLAAVKEEKTPLETRMGAIGRILSIICLVVAGGAALLGVLRGYGWLEMLIWGISLAVAAVPEALPAVVTGALAIGTTRMARRNAIVKRLPAVETMGCTTVICTDKTGTLTKNEMTARRLFLDRRLLEVTGMGYGPGGEFLEGKRVLPPGSDQVLGMAARIAALCNDATLNEEEGVWRLRGDPTEGALLTMAGKAGLDTVRLTAEFPRVTEIPFSSARKTMTTVHQEEGGFWACLKGAPEALLSRSSLVLTSRGEEPLREEDRRETMMQAQAMAGQALRVLGLAYRRFQEIPDPDPEAVEADLVWVGLAGLMDPPRPEAAGAVDRCRQAGIRVIMITGDHPDTAAAVAREVGLLAASREHQVVTGAEMSRMDDAALQKALERAQVFARVAPEHKLRLVEALKAQGQVVAMTGDGVNDAPALKRADIGVAMGLTGTEVTKETAAMILADDNFATLVAAVEEGRAIFDNIKKYLVYLLSCNLAEILILTGAFFLGTPLPLIALQILWINLTTDGLPALALGVDPQDPDIMNRPPRSPEERVFNRPVNVLLGAISVYLTLVLIPLFIYYFYWNPAGEGSSEAILMRAQTMVFVTLVLMELVNAFNCRSEHHSLFTVGLFANRFLWVAVVISLVMMLGVVQWEPGARLFHTTPLNPQEWLLASGLSLTMIPVVEAAKWWIRRGARGRG